MDKKTREELQAVSEMMKTVSQDSGVPRNIRFAVLQTSDKILRDSNDLSVTLGSAIYSMEDIANDINMPAHTRTEIWSIISALESVKEKLNKPK